MTVPFQPLYLKAEAVPNVPNGWTVSQINDIADVLKSGRLYDENSVSQSGEIPVVNQSEADFHGFHSDEPGVIATEDEPVATFANHTCAMRLMKRPFSCIQNIFSRVGRKGICDTAFFYYATLGRVTLAGYKGHHPIYRQAWIPLPPLQTQIRIREILSGYDDMIENNRRRIALLEESARLLYREWFVRLRFPGHEHTRIVNGVPEGWRNLKLGDICTDNREVVSPESLEPDTPYIGLEHMPRRSISLSDWGNAEQVTSSKLRFNTGDILFGKIRPYFHKVGIAFTDGVVSSDAFVICPTVEALKSFVLMTVSSDEFIANTSQAMKEGSKMPRADWKQMIQYPVLLPPEGLLADFTETITSITNQLRNLSTQNQKLRTARDLLLPKLMSGEIGV